MKSNAQLNGAVDIFPFPKVALFKLPTVKGLKHSASFNIPLNGTTIYGSQATSKHCTL